LDHQDDDHQHHHERHLGQERSVACHALFDRAASDDRSLRRQALADLGDIGCQARVYRRRFQPRDRIGLNGDRREPVAPPHITVVQRIGEQLFHLQGLRLRGKCSVDHFWNAIARHENASWINLELRGQTGRRNNCIFSASGVLGRLIGSFKFKTCLFFLMVLQAKVGVT
jgi:hypothetical protein